MGKFSNYLHQFAYGFDKIVRRPDERWAMALGAMYDILHEGEGAELAPYGGIFGGARSAAILKEFWGVDGKTGTERHNEALGVLNWLVEEGHRNDPDFAAPPDPEAEKDLLAWDIARAVMVARHAFSADLVSEEEAWTSIRRVALMAQANFASWEDYGRHYVNGQIRWAGERQEPVDKAVDFLLNDSKSPWRELDWKAPLDFAKPWQAKKTPWYLSPKIAIIPVVCFSLAHLIHDSNLPGINIDKIFAKAKPIISAADEFSKWYPIFDKDYFALIRNGKFLTAHFSSTERTVRHKVTAFRYGVDEEVPKRELSSNAASILGFPREIDSIPDNARFLTVQARLDDGTLSPVRRFEIPPPGKRGYHPER